MASPEGANSVEILRRLRQGDGKAADLLLPLVYKELRAIADRMLRREGNRYLHQPSSIVHEAYLRLVDERKTDWRDRAHFVAVATSVMRNVLVDRARRRAAQKRGGGQEHVTLDDGLAADGRHSVNILEIDLALSRLSAQDERQGKIASLRMFGGLRSDEIAEVLAISRRTVERDWRHAQAWLQVELSGESERA